MTKTKNKKTKTKNKKQNKTKKNSIIRSSWGFVWPHMGYFSVWPHNEDVMSAWEVFVISHIVWEESS